MRFASLNRKNTGYMVKDYDWRERRLGAVEWGREYDTYGDGLTQHAYETGIAPDNLGDFLASLAQFLMDNQEEVAHIEKRWPHYYDVGREQVRFLMNLRPKDGKRLYFSATDLKVSSSDSKRYDKRWEEVPTWADGTPGAVSALAFMGGDKTDHRDVLEKFALYGYIRQIVAEENDGYYGKSAMEWLNITTPYTDSAFAVMDRLIESFRKQKEAERILEGYKHNTSRKTEEEAAAEVA